MPNSKCTELTIHAWAIGGESFYYPREAGFSLNTEQDPKYLLLEIHYDNPDKRTDMVDNSGFRFFYTELLREYDSGIVSAGIYPGAHSQIIPQGQKNFTNYGYCSSNCSKDGEETNIYAVLPHAHLQG